MIEPGSGSEGDAELELLIAVIHDEEYLDEVLAGFLELGITGATVVASEGMARVLSQDIPIFAGLRTLMSRARPRNFTVFSVVRGAAKVDAAVDLLQQVCGPLDEPATGIAFTVPVNRVVGLAPELEEPNG